MSYYVATYNSCFQGLVAKCSTVMFVRSDGNVTLCTSNRIPIRGPVVMHTSFYGATIVMTSCTIVSQKTDVTIAAP